MSSDEAIARVAARQHGLITLGQALNRGLSARAVQHRVETGRWIALRRGVFLVHGVPPTYEQTVLAVCLAAGAPAVASHMTAARLWDLGLPLPAQIEVTSLPNRRLRLDGVKQHRAREIPIVDLGTLNGLPVTRPARTLIDCSGMVDRRVLAVAVNDALRRKLVTLEQLRACHERLVAQGGRQTRTMGELLAERQPGFDPGGSERELRVLAVFAAAGLPMPVQQHRVQVGSRVFYLDFAYPEALVGLEFDGYDRHGTFLAFHADRERARLITSVGWRIIPITSRTKDADLVRDVSRLLQRVGHFSTWSVGKCPTPTW